MLQCSRSCWLPAEEGGGGLAFFPVNTVTMAPDKTMALADGQEDVTVTAVVKDFAGRPLSNAAISFVVSSGSGTLHSADLVTSASGTAAVKVNRDPVAGPATNETVTVTASASGASGSASIKFINMPSTATIRVGLNKVVTDLAVLTFDLASTPTQTTAFLSISPINEANTAHFVFNTNTFTSIGVSTWPSAFNFTLMTSPGTAPFGITTVVNSPVLELVYNIDPTITSLPTFSVGPQNITAIGPLPDALDIVPALIQADFFSTTTFDTE